MNILNLTPHSLQIHLPGGQQRELMPAGPAPRLEPQRVALGVVGGVPLVRTTLGAPVGLPPPQPGTILIVSALVAEACPERSDLAYPGEAVRDEHGKIVGCLGLCAGPGLAQFMESLLPRCSLGWIDCPNPSPGGCDGFHG